MAWRGPARLGWARQGLLRSKARRFTPAGFFCAHLLHWRKMSERITYTMKLPDGRAVRVKVPSEYVERDRSGELAFTPEGVRFLDRVRATQKGAAASGE